MEDIKWLEVVLDTTEEELEGLCARLTANGVTGMAIEDEEDFKTFLEQNRQYWDYVDEGLMEQMRGVCRVKLYVTDDDDGKKQLARWLEGIDLPYTAASLGENDWAHSWQKYYKPMAVGERLYIVPEWEREEPVPAGKVPLYLNPGLTFGTGNHASTQLCLAGLEAYTVPGQPVLDLGCGSGILSIAALALGASEAAAVDIDPKAVDVAYENAALNGVGRDRYTVLAGDVLSDQDLVSRLGTEKYALVLGASKALAVDIDPKAVDVAYENAALNGIGRDRYTVRAGDVLSDAALARELAQQRYHLVLANIVADVIIPLAPHVPPLLEEDGVFLCSGIIDSRAGEVAAALERAGLAVTRKREKNGWAALEARARG